MKKRNVYYNDVTDTAYQYNEKQQVLYENKYRSLVDQKTGEVIEVQQVIKKAYGQKQFWKIYLMDFLQILGVLDSKQVDIFVYIIENTEPANNTFIGTYDQIEKNVNVSRPTIAKIMKKLQENNFIKKIHNSVWQVNPDIMMKGSHFKKSLLINYYDEAPTKTEKTTPKEYKNEDKSTVFEIEEGEKIYGDITVETILNK